MRRIFASPTFQSRVLLLAAVGVFTATFVGGPPLAQSAATEIVFASAPDESGTVQRLVDSFNEANEGKVKVTWRQMSGDINTHHGELVKELSSKQSDIDVVASDVVWTAQFARKRWVVDVTRRFYDAYERASFLAPAMDSATSRLRVWGVPWYTDAGVLFYRKDKLAQSGVGAPPSTWEELAKVTKKVMKDTGTRYGFVFQGAEYEGGTANAAEFIWSAGGDLVSSQPTVTGVVVSGVAETDSVVVGSAASARGLDIARKLIVDGVSPESVTSFREKQGLDAFLAGDAVFLRSWPGIFSALAQAGLTLDQYGVAPLPAASNGGESASCLGGWNLMVNASSSRSERSAAWKLIRYLTAAEQQKRQAREAGMLPVLTALYDDAKLARDVPMVGLSKTVFTSQLRARPSSPVYSEMSAIIARVFNETLKGKLTGKEAADVLQKELSAIVVRNR